MLSFFDKKTPYDAAQQLEDGDHMLASVTPVVQEIHSNRAWYMLGQGTSMLTEGILYVLAVGCFLFLVIMNRVFPFYILGEIIDKKIYEQALTGRGDIEAFHVAVKALVVLIGILLILIGMMKRQQRIQRSMLQKSGAELRKVEQYFLRKKEELVKLTQAAPAAGNTGSSAGPAASSETV